MRKIVQSVVTSFILSRVLRKTKSLFWYYYQKVLIRTSDKRNSKIIKQLKQKESYNVGFFLLTSSAWKFDSLYKNLDSSNLFRPVVIIYPLITYGEEVMIREMKLAEALCQKNEYEYMSTWNEEKEQWIDIRQSIALDIVFFSNPYSHSFKLYSIMNFLDIFTCYVPYSLRMEKIYKIKFNTLLQNLVCRNYYESEIHLDIAKQHTANKGRNVVVTGHPIFDALKSANPINSAWKQQNRRKKRVIWAPHWTIEGFQQTTLDWSSFLLFCDVMLEIAKEFEDEIQFSFKPHALLESTLKKDTLWGIKKTDTYYNTWRNLGNGQVNNSDFVDLFVSSDALIHDSGSFMIEYLVVNKPVIYLHNRQNVSDRFNKYGEFAYACHYKAYSSDDIRKFLKNIILDESDHLHYKRTKFYSDFLDFGQKKSLDFILEDILAACGKSYKSA